MQEHLTGMSVVQAFAAERREYKKFDQINKQHKQANIKAIFAYSVFFPIVELIMALSIGLLVWWAANHTNAFGTQNNIAIAAKITSFILCLNLLYRPLRVIADKFNILQMGMIAGERVFKIVDEKDTTPNNGKIGAQNLQGNLSFENVWFGYNEDNDVLKNISFQINKGETLAIVGHTGSGKTSIISLINRLYHIKKGVIKVDDINIGEYELVELRSKIAVVLQDVFLFSGSIKSNLVLKNQDVSSSEIEKVAREIGAYDFIEKPFKVDRLVLVAERALEASRLKREVKDLQSRSVQASRIIGSSIAMNQLRQAVDRATDG